MITNELLKNVVVENISTAVNRSAHQTKELFEFCDYNIKKLLKLEEKIKNNFIFYSPGTKEEVEKILAITEDKVKILNFTEPYFKLILNKQ